MELNLRCYRGIFCSVCELEIFAVSCSGKVSATFFFLIEVIYHLSLLAAKLSNLVDDIRNIVYIVYYTCVCVYSYVCIYIG